MHRLRLLDAINAFTNGALKMCAVAHSLMRMQPKTPMEIKLKTKIEQVIK